MDSKIAFLLAFGYCLGAVIADDCSFTDDEKNLNCCDLPNVRSQFLEKCAEELNYVFPPVKTDHYDNCAEECIFTKAEFIDENKKINGDKIMELGMKIKKTEWVDTVHHGIEHCNAKTYDNGSGKCVEGPAKYTHCLVHYLYSHCPDFAWKSNDQCNAVKAKLQKCPDLIPPPHPFSIIPK